MNERDVWEKSKEAPDIRLHCPNGAPEAWQAASAGKAELLEALEHAVGNLEECAEELCAGPLSGLAATIEKARAAIKKHGGQS